VPQIGAIEKRCMIYKVSCYDSLTFSILERKGVKYGKSIINENLYYQPTERKAGFTMDKGKRAIK